MSLKCNKNRYDVITSWTVLLHHIVTVGVCKTFLFYLMQ